MNKIVGARKVSIAAAAIIAIVTLAKAAVNESGDPENTPLYAVCIVIVAVVAISWQGYLDLKKGGPVEDLKASDAPVRNPG